ncbi:MAG TPA: SIMPL domain-containing protein [Allosphingosinicella sp.]|uniref:SIMPL domain-containing protein n=1 Tax=Allosphingosinicella sp. TaxID=2823234 RepID=UPI002EDAE3A0
MLRMMTMVSVFALAGAAAAQPAPPPPPPQPTGVILGVAQPGEPLHAVAGTRLDVVATGEVTRVPDIARINAGVQTLAATASAAIQENAARMQRVRAALRRAGIADRDIQTSSINLYPEYRHSEGAAPQLIGYRAGNEVTVSFRDIANTGKILDALVAEGANSINGPMLTLDKPEAALDEARTAAIRTARARAELYARAIGKGVGRILSISEAGGGMPYRPMMRQSAGYGESRPTNMIEPGEQTIGVSLQVSFELL